MAELISSGTTLANSADITVSAGSSATLLLKSATAQIPQGANADIQAKSADGNYYTIGRLTDQEPIKVLAAAGTFRVVRNPLGTAYGVDQN